MDAFPDEKLLGIEVFYTDEPGIGGRLRSRPEDFMVEEVPKDIPEDPDGDYAIIEVRSRNWETNLLVREIARRLRISRDRIGFAGTKDRRAITTQYLSIYLPKEDLQEIRIKDVDIRFICRSKKRIGIGDLIGNRFSVVIREIELDGKEAERRVKIIEESLREGGGFPNFYGFQRFGSLRPVTHLVGKEIIRGNFDKAVNLYLAFTTEKEDKISREARLRFSRERDVAKALLYFPKHLSFEIAILNELVKGKEPLDALQSLPKNLLVMFVCAYQSYLFNRILSSRIKRGLPLNEAMEGDIVIPLGRYGEEKELIPVTSRNMEKVNRMIKLGKAVVSGAVIGYDTFLADGEMGEIERKIMEEEKLDPRDFIIPEIPFISSKGGRRALLSKYRDFSYQSLDDSVKMEFFLWKGAYATSLLREFMKCEDIRCY